MIPRWTLILLLVVVISTMPGSSTKFRPFNEKLMIPKKRFPPKSPTLTSTTSTTTTAGPTIGFSELQTRPNDYTDATESDVHNSRPVTSLEGLVLEAIKLVGLEVCSSSFAQAVMQNNWRNDTPTRDERTDSDALREKCQGAPLAVPSFYKGSGKTSKPSGVIANSGKEEVTYSLVPSQGRAGEPPMDSETFKKLNEGLKDRSADCKPRKIPIEIPPEPHTTWIPKCTLIERCGGCCKHESLKCIPTEKNGISFVKKQVVAMDSTGKTFKIKQVSIEKHNKCTCVCKVKKSDCNEAQSYDSRNCRCVCKNKSTQCEPPLYWDERSCKCRCPDQTITECSTGSYFASHLCRCITANEIMEDESKRAKRRL